MSKVISVKFRRNNRAYWFDPGENDIKAGDGVIVETSRGEEYGSVTEGVKEVAEESLTQPLKPIIRIATEEDARMRDEFIAKESEALRLCQEKITEHNLDMKLVDVEYTYNGSKVVFYFTADERVDFRDLVKDLAYALRTRIELRQIGVRDEAKMLGGLGPCGRPVCCNAFLDDFRPVSIKMAKEQNLSLSPTKISGLCGRLMCCLAYEQNAYEEAHKRMPRVGKETETPEGTGVVVESNAITERVKVRLTQEDGTFVIKEFPAAETGCPGCPVKKAEAPETAEPEREGEVVAEAVPENAGEQKPSEKQERRRNRDERPDRRRDEKKPAAEKTAEEAGNKEENAAKDGEKPEGEPRRRHHRGGRGRGGKNRQQGDAGASLEGVKNENAGEEKKQERPQRKPRPEKKKNSEITRLPGETIGQKDAQPAKNPDAEKQPRSGGRDRRPRHGNGEGRQEKKENNASGKNEKAVTRLPGENIGGKTVLPGETIGGVKSAGTAENAGTESAGETKPRQPYGRQHRRHSFGK